MPFSNILLWIGFIVVLFLAVLFMTLFYTSTLTFLPRMYYNVTWSPLTFLPRMYYNVTWSQCTLPTLSRTHLPLTALASYPGSGNTWLRHLVQSATGIITGGVYKGDNDLLENGFPGETISNSSVILIKTHRYGVKERVKYTRAVLLMRNPYDAMTAEFNRRHGGHIGHASDLDFKVTFLIVIEWLSSSPNKKYLPDMYINMYTETTIEFDKFPWSFATGIACNQETLTLPELLVSLRNVMHLEARSHSYGNSNELLIDWTKYLTNVSDSWMRMNHDWLQFSGSLYVTRYENLVLNPVKEIKSLLSFLNVPVPFREYCVRENLNGKHKRKGMNKKRTNLFPMTVRKKIDADIAKIEHEISKATMNRKP